MGFFIDTTNDRIVKRYKEMNLKFKNIQDKIIEYIVNKIFKKINKKDLSIEELPNIDIKKIHIDSNNLISDELLNNLKKQNE